MIGYKLFRVRRDGTLGSLFIHRSAVLPIGKRLTAKSYPTKGFAVRPGFHICALPNAPHLSPKGRKWYVVEFSGNVRSHERPQSQGGLWYTATYMTIVKEYK
jgi:hypothetical protein